MRFDESFVKELEDKISKLEALVKMMAETLERFSKAGMFPLLAKEAREALAKSKELLG
jgi:hypothetical protein